MAKRNGMSTFATGFASALMTLGLTIGSSAGAEEDSTSMPWLDNGVYKVSLDIRGRIELADVDTLKQSEAYTLRTRAGLGLKPWHGLSLFGEVENTTAADDDSYFDIVSTPNGKTAIADPENTELNRAYIQYEHSEWAGLKLKGGRQRIKLDDDRFVGNVGWRQNEQTYDAALAQTSLGVEGLTAQYIHLWEVQRIFGDAGPPPGRDFESDSHLIRLHYDAPDILSVSVFAYLLDFETDAPAASSDTFGLRLAGGLDASEDIFVKYVASYARQQDSGDNPVNYDANYVAAEATVGSRPLGSLTVGYELLGSDDGAASFVTPLATAHKFNGWADVFLTNGAPTGLQDLYVGIAPALPLGLKGKLVYHRFWSDDGNTSLGDEVDAIVSRQINQHLAALTKFAWFDGTSDGPLDIWRLWFQLDFKY